MEKPVITSFSGLAPLIIQKYERYLPSAFDDSMTMLQKVNKVIEHLDQIGELTNNVIVQWNAVMEWVMNDQLGDEVSAKLDEMVTDGTLDQIINQTLFGSFETRLTNNESKSNENSVYKNYDDVGKFTKALRNREITKIKLIGDSNGQGYLATPSQTFFEQFKLLMNNLFTGHTISFENVSQGGKEWVWFDENKTSYVNESDDVVMIMLGTNDRNIAYSYSDIITAIESFLLYAKNQANHVIVFNNPPTGFNEQEYTFGVEQINQMIRKVCYEKGYTYVDIAQSFNEMVYTMGLNISDVLQPDNLHYTDLGHEIIYKSMQAKLGLVHNRDNQWFKPIQKVDRTGLVAYPSDSQIINFTTPISKTKNGVIVVWAPYNSATAVMDNDYKIYTHIPKRIVLDQITENGGTEMTMNVLLHSRDFTIVSPKTLFITDTRIKGTIENSSEPFTSNGITITPKGYAISAIYTY